MHYVLFDCIRVIITLIIFQSETHSPFDNQHSLKNGFFNGLNSETTGAEEDDAVNTKLELADLKRQVLFLQGQLEDKEKTLYTLQEQMVKLVTDNDTAHSAPASTVAESSTCNAATQTERVRFFMSKNNVLLNLIQYWNNILGKVK